MRPPSLQTALLLVGVLAACSEPSQGGDADAGGETQDESKVLTLWDGGELDGWSQAGPGEFVLVDGALKTTGGMGMLWYSAEAFDDFILELEWKVEEANDNAGVFVRFPDITGVEEGEWVAVREGYELQICDEGPDTGITGAVYSFQGPTSMPTRPVGEWNHYRIQVVGQQYTITVNDVLVNEYTGERGLSGHIGLQNHGDADAVHFRNISVRKL